MPKKSPHHIDLSSNEGLEGLRSQTFGELKDRMKAVDEGFQFWFDKSEESDGCWHIFHPAVEKVYTIEAEGGFDTILDRPTVGAILDRFAISRRVSTKSPTSVKLEESGRWKRINNISSEQDT